MGCKDKKEYFLIVFPSVHYSMRAEKCLKKFNLNPIFNPIPPEITSDCNFGLEIKEKNITQCREILQENDINTEGIFHITEKEGNREIKELY